MLHSLEKYEKEVSHLTYLRNNLSFAHYCRTFNVNFSSIENLKKRYFKVNINVLVFWHFLNLYITFIYL